MSDQFSEDFDVSGNTSFVQDKVAISQLNDITLEDLNYEETAKEAMEIVDDYVVTKRGYRCVLCKINFGYQKYFMKMAAHQKVPSHVKNELSFVSCGGKKDDIFGSYTIMCCNVCHVSYGSQKTRGNIKKMAEHKKSEKHIKIVSNEEQQKKEEKSNDADEEMEEPVDPDSIEGVFRRIDPTVKQEEEFIMAAFEIFMERHWPHANSEFYCSICNYLEFKTEKDAEVHKSSTQHKAFLRNYDKAFCKACQLHAVDEEGMEEHMETDNHKTFSAILRNTKEAAHKYFPQHLKKKKKIIKPKAKKEKTPSKSERKTQPPERTPQHQGKTKTKTETPIKKPETVVKKGKVVVRQRPPSWLDVSHLVLLNPIPHDQLCTPSRCYVCRKNFNEHCRYEDHLKNNYEHYKKLAVLINVENRKELSDKKVPVVKQKEGDKRLISRRPRHNSGTEEQSTEEKCEVCDMKLNIISQDSLNAHRLSMFHLKAVKEKRLVFYMRGILVDLDLEVILSKSNLKEEMKAKAVAELEGNAYATPDLCWVCQVRTRNNARNMAIHIKTKQHINQVAIYEHNWKSAAPDEDPLSNSSIVNEFECSQCCVQFENREEAVKHCYTQKHIARDSYGKEKKKKSTAKPAVTNNMPAIKVEEFWWEPYKPPAPPTNELMEKQLQVVLDDGYISSTECHLCTQTFSSPKINDVFIHVVSQKHKARRGNADCTNFEAILEEMKLNTKAKADRKLKAKEEKQAHGTNDVSSQRKEVIKPTERRRTYAERISQTKETSIYRIQPTESQNSSRTRERGRREKLKPIRTIVSSKSSHRTVRSQEFAIQQQQPGSSHGYEQQQKPGSYDQSFSEWQNNQVYQQQPRIKPLVPLHSTQQGFYSQQPQPTGTVFYAASNTVVQPTPRFQQPVVYQSQPQPQPQAHVNPVSRNMEDESSRLGFNFPPRDRQDAAYLEGILSDGHVNADGCRLCHRSFQSGTDYWAVHEHIKSQKHLYLKDNPRSSHRGASNPLKRRMDNQVQDYGRSKRFYQ